MNPIELKTRDTGVVEAALPAMLMLTMLEQARKQGVEMRFDVEQKLANAVLVPMKMLDPIGVSRVAKRLDDTATTLIRDINAPDPARAIYVCAMFALLLVEEDRIFDKGNMATLVALMLMDDIKHDEPDVNGQRPLFAANESVWKKEAKAILFRAHIMGLYQRADLKLTA